MHKMTTISDHTSDTWSPAQRSDIARQLANTIAGEVRFGLHDRMLYATDASLFQVEPLGVVIPANIDDAVAAIRFCAANSLPMLPRGGGTSLAGQCTNRAVVIDLSVHCRHIGNVTKSIDGQHATINVEPGVSPDDLNDAIAHSGMFFAPDPATSRHCNIGGCIGNNAAGARSIKYKRTSENVQAVRACLADGSIVEFSHGSALRDPRVRNITERVVHVIARNAPLIRQRFPKTLRRSAGYQLDVILKQMESAGWRDAPPRGHDAPDRANTEQVPEAVPEAVLAAINLSHLLCGSEGTLAFTLGATLSLHPKPKAKALATLGFSSLDASIERVVPILSTDPTAVELLDDTVVDLALANAEYRAYAELMPKPADGRPLKAVLYVEYFGQTDAEVRDAVEKLRRVVPGVAMDVYTDAPSQLKAWKLRKAGEPLLHGIPGSRKPITFVEDNAVPVENLAAFVKDFRAMVAQHGTIAAYYAHASVGVLHIRPLIDIHTEDDRARMRSIATHAAALAKKYGGVMSGEHGDGRVRTPFLEDYYGPELMAAFREIKQIFDPHNLLNPGNIVDLNGNNPRPIESITQRLRVLPESPSTTTPTTNPSTTPARERGLTIDPNINTFYDYHDQHGFDSAVEMCNGSGVCRKKQGGTMCPSYMATLDERHSTRGRGNALRLAISGQFASNDATLTTNPDASPAQPQWNDPETIETLHLCLSCKACKTECPSNVDIARLKSEYTAQRYREQGSPWQARFFGSIRLLNRLGSITPIIANWLNATTPIRSIINRALGLHPMRSLPPFATSLARTWRRTPESTPARPRVVFFGDCFSMFNEPGIGLASKRVFEAFGYRIDLADAGCCGRAKISLGLLPQAIDEIDATIDKLTPLINDDRIAAILVAEPSCLSAIKDDWLTLNLKTPIELRKRLAAKCFLPEDYLHKHWDSHPTRPAFKPKTTDRAKEILLHGHCHQKALWGAQTSSALLARIADVRVLDTGCCGMAGSFGYTHDRYDLSMKIGELSLFPAIRSASPAARVIAPGTSCRHQIHDGTATKAIHPMEFVADMLA